jgi:hypothetical protein
MVVAFSPVPEVRAQHTPPVEAGETVVLQLTQPRNQTFKGRVQGIEGEMLLFAPEGLPDGFTSGYTRIPFRTVERIQRVTGEKRNTWKGLMIGSLSGALIGATLGAASGSDDDGDGFVLFTPEEMALMLGASLGAVGGVTGLIIGALTRSDTVEEASLPTTRLLLHPSFTGGVNVGLRIKIGR